jgi:glycopeptide antibiotics resistance protein
LFINRLIQKTANGVTVQISLRIPIIVMVLAAIAVPIELRPLGRAVFSFDFDALDCFSNVAGFVPVGIVLGESGLLRGVILAAMMSIFAETGQLIMMHRDPSVMDVIANTVGASLGVVIARHWQLRSLSFKAGRATSLLAVALSIVIIWGAGATSSHAINDRGVTSPGDLEASWKFDEMAHRVASDSSGHDLYGSFRNDPELVPGVRGSAIKLDGERNYVDFGHPSSLQLRGSMTISAWIQSTSYPKDDAVIVSQLLGGPDYFEGFQLDTTIDRGPRTIGFKLSNKRDELMARYGATPLALNTWYHVAGVYDADARTLDVYLNGKLDNGFLLGAATGSQHSSRGNVRVGSRSDSKEFNFAGLIDEVHIYSFPLKSSDIAADMSGEKISRPVRSFANHKNLRDPHAVISDSEDTRLPVAVAALGVFLTIACIGLWPSAGRLFGPVFGFAAGLFVYSTKVAILPSFNLWLFPIVALTGSASIVVSTRILSCQPSANNQAAFAES